MKTEKSQRLIERWLMSVETVHKSYTYINRERPKENNNDLKNSFHLKRIDVKNEVWKKKPMIHLKVLSMTQHFFCVNHPSSRLAANIFN